MALFQCHARTFINWYHCQFQILQRHFLLRKTIWRCFSLHCILVLQLCSSKEPISFDERSFHKKKISTHLLEFWIIFERILIQAFLLFWETWSCFPMKWNLLFKLNFCWGFGQNLEGNFWKPPFAFTPKHANLSKDICTLIYHLFLSAPMFNLINWYFMISSRNINLQIKLITFKMGGWCNWFPQQLNNFQSDCSLICTAIPLPLDCFPWVKISKIAIYSSFAAGKN